MQMQMLNARSPREAHVVADIERRRIAISVEGVETFWNEFIKLLFFFLGILANIRDVPFWEYYHMPRIIRIQIERYYEELCLVNNQFFDILRPIPDKTKYATFWPFPLKICNFIETEEIFHM